MNCFEITFIYSICVIILSHQANPPVGRIRLPSPASTNHPAREPPLQRPEISSLSSSTQLIVAVASHPSLAGAVIPPWPPGSRSPKVRARASSPLPSFRFVAEIHLSYRLRSGGSPGNSRTASAAITPWGYDASCEIHWHLIACLIRHELFVGNVEL